MTVESMEANGEYPSMETLELIGVHVHPDQAGPQLYTVMLMYEDARGGKDRPLTDLDGYILWFREPDLAAHAVALGDEGFRKHATVPAEVAATYDFAAMAWPISQGVGKVSGEVVEALNLLLDLVEATGFPIPAGYRRDLHALADHLTFSTDLAAFLTEGEDLRVRLMDAITWCVGAVTIKSSIVGNPVPGATHTSSS